MPDRASLSYGVGDITVGRIIELEAPFMPAFEMLPDLTPELLERHRADLQPRFLDGDEYFILSYQCHVVRTPHHTILVDSCLGNDKHRARPEWHLRRGTEFMQALAAHGLTVEDIDFVMCTHLHGDHVGWNTRLLDGRWVPTFPNARYILHRDEVEMVTAAHRETPNPVFADSVLPVIEAGQADLVTDDFAIGDHVRLLPAKGHTCGHYAVCLGQHRDDAVLTGDLLHVPLQLWYPELGFARDADMPRASATRRAVLERFCETDTICFLTHLPGDSAGHVIRRDTGFDLRPHSPD